MGTVNNIETVFWWFFFNLSSDVSRDSVQYPEEDNH